MKTATLGLALTLLVTLALMAGWGKPAVLPGLCTGVLATLLQIVAVARLRRDCHASNAQFFGAAGVGMLLRMAGIGVILAAILIDRTLFPALPTALGYLGVVIPLLFLEVRFVS